MKKFWNTLANLLMLRQEPVAEQPAPETNAAHIVTPITCADCGTELTIVVGNDTRAGHHRHPKGRSCRPVRRAKKPVEVSATEVSNVPSN